ncbi:hypothetical protein D3C72_2217590 [compost metagenome]
MPERWRQAAFAVREYHRACLAALRGGGRVAGDDQDAGQPWTGCECVKNIREHGARQRCALGLGQHRCKPLLGMLEALHGDHGP